MGHITTEDVKKSERTKVLVELSDEMKDIKERIKRIKVKGKAYGISLNEVIKFSFLVKKVFK